MSVSVLVNIVILALGVFAGTTILANLPENVVQALNYLLPSLFGALFVQFALSKPKLAPIALTLGLVFSLLVARGVVPFYTTTLVAVFGTMFIGIALYKKKLI
jgi:branched-subunit amino acid transport protein